MVDFIEFFGGIKGEKTHDFANRVRIVGLLRVILGGLDPVLTAFRLHQSSSLTKLIATPFLPNRPLRPIR